MSLGNMDSHAAIADDGSTDSFGELPNFGGSNLERKVSTCSTDSSDGVSPLAFKRSMTAPAMTESTKVNSKLNEFRTKHNKIIEMLRQGSDADTDKIATVLGFGPHRQVQIAPLRLKSQLNGPRPQVVDAAVGAAKALAESQAQLLCEHEDRQARALARARAELQGLREEASRQISGLQAGAERYAEDVDVLVAQAHAAQGELRSAQELANSCEQMGDVRAQAAMGMVEQLLTSMVPRAHAAVLEELEVAASEAEIARTGASTLEAQVGFLIPGMQDLRAEAAAAQHGVAALDGHLSGLAEQVAQSGRNTHALRQLCEHLPGKAQIEALQAELKTYRQKELARESLANAWAQERRQLQDEVTRLARVVEQRYSRALEVAAAAAAAAAAGTESYNEVATVGIHQEAEVPMALLHLATNTSPAKYGKVHSIQSPRALKLAAIIGGLVLALEGVASARGIGQGGSLRFGLQPAAIGLRVAAASERVPQRRARVHAKEHGLQSPR